MKPLIDIICSGGLLFCSVLGYADGLDEWHLRYSPPQGTYFRSVASGPDRLLAVGDIGLIVTSTDDGQLMVANSGTTRDLFRVASGNGMFVATRFSGHGDPFKRRHQLAIGWVAGARHRGPWCCFCEWPILFVGFRGFGCAKAVCLEQWHGLVAQPFPAPAW